MSRPHTNAKRSELKPGPRCVDSKDKPSGITNATTKQYNHTGKKYSGPNYPQKDPHIVTSGIIK